ncbi:hypothetical protein [Mycobacterium sp. M23085]|uniref:hypothetical protein n=1 Tax=Mycobacterium sp. M23085 TaxID=3378087 RepID=UPI0038782298
MERYAASKSGAGYPLATGTSPTGPAVDRASSFVNYYSIWRATPKRSVIGAFVLPDICPSSQRTPLTAFSELKT